MRCWGVATYRGLRPTISTLAGAALGRLIVHGPIAKRGEQAAARSRSRDEAEAAGAGSIATRADDDRAVRHGVSRGTPSGRGVYGPPGWRLRRQRERSFAHVYPLLRLAGGSRRA